MSAGPGRPSTGTRVDFRIPADLLSQLDAMAAEHAVKRADMLRRMVKLAADTAERDGWDVLR